MGGTDDESNLIKLTVDEHAEAHRILYEKYGKKEDYLAWQGLNGQIGKDEILKEMYRQNGVKLNNRIKSGEIQRKCWNKGKTGVYSEDTLEKMRRPKTDEHKAAMRKPKSNTKNMGQYERTPSVKNKLRDAAKKQFDLEGRKRHSEIMKKNRRKCVYCGMESNASNVTRHEKKCSSSSE